MSHAFAVSRSGNHRLQPRPSRLQLGTLAVRLQLGTLAIWDAGRTTLQRGGGCARAGPTP